MTIYRAPDETTARTMQAEPAEWLSVRRVIRSAGEFALSRGGSDNALAAYLEGLDAIGITIPEPAAEATRYRQSFERSTSYYVTLTEPADDHDRALSDIYAPIRRGINSRANVRRVHALLAASGYQSTETRLSYLDRNYGSNRLYITLTHTFNRTHVTEENAADVTARWTERNERNANALDRMTIRELAQDGITTEQISDQPYEYSYSEPMRRSQRISTRVEQAAAAADRLAPSDAFIRTDDFLAMMRDQAISNHWCPEHHSIIQRLTNGQREPFGTRATVSINVTQEFTVDMTSYYGSEGSPEGLRQRLEYASRQMMDYANTFARSEFLTDERDVQIEIEPVADDYEPRSAIALDSLTVQERTDPDSVIASRPSWTVDRDQDETGEWCDECQDYH